MIVRDNMNLESLAASLGEMGEMGFSLRKSIKKVGGALKKASPVQKIKSTIKAKDPLYNKVFNRGARKGQAAVAPEPEYEEVSEPESSVPAYHPPYYPMPGQSQSPPAYYQPAAPYGYEDDGSNMQVDPYADDGVIDSEELEKEEALPMAPDVPAVTAPTPTIAPTTGTDYTWWIVGGVGIVAVGGLAYFLLRKKR